MNTLKKTLAIAFAGVMMVATLALSGCFGLGGGGNSGSSGSDLAGTWKLDYAEDYYGDPYDVSGMADQVVLVVKSGGKQATFYYFDDDAFTGTLSRDASSDSYYATNGYVTECYHLTNSAGEWWEFCFVTPEDGSDSFWYFEVGPSDDYDAIYLVRS